LPFAISSKSPEILEYILDIIFSSDGYEHVLRVISENKYITSKIKHKLLGLKLAEKYKQKLIA